MSNDHAHQETTHPGLRGQLPQEAPTEITLLAARTWPVWKYAVIDTVYDPGELTLKLTPETALRGPVGVCQSVRSGRGDDAS